MLEHLFEPPFSLMSREGAGLAPASRTLLPPAVSAFPSARFSSALWHLLLKPTPGKSVLASGCPVGLLQLLCCLLAGGADVIAEGHPAAKDKFHFGGGFPARWPQLLHAPKRKSSDGLQP
ncbi:hypothetical protein AGIG_G10322 [Arapaima gigas]